jgi:hypothetical protein
MWRGEAGRPTPVKCYCGRGGGIDGLPGEGLTEISLSGILSRPWSLLSSRPPDVELPLPLGLDDAPVVVLGAALGFAELAAGSPVVEPRPLGSPLCARASDRPPNSTLKRINTNFMAQTPVGLRVQFWKRAFVPLHGLALRKLRSPAGNHPLPIERFDRSRSAQSTASNQSYASIQLRTYGKQIQAEAK